MSSQECLIYQVGAVGVLPAPHVPDAQPRSTAPTATASPLQPAGHDAPTQYMPRVGNLPDPPGDAAQTAEVTDPLDIKTAAAASAQRHERPSHELMYRVLRGLRRL